MKLGNAAHIVLAEARRHVWAVDATFWDSFSRVLTLDALPVLEVEAAKPRRQTATETRTGVAVIPLQGVITPKASILSMLFGGGGGLASFRDSLREAVASDDVDAIILDVDSPGGSVALVEETAADLRAAREVKPVVAVANVDAGSAAYWLAAQADELIVTPSGMVGSVGAYILHMNFAGMNEKMGIEPTFISAGRFKTEGNPEEALTDEATAHLQSTVDEAHATFVRDVAEGRGVPEKTVRRGYGEGRMLTAQRALEAGMVDGVETLESVVGRYLSGAAVEAQARRAAVPTAEERIAARRRNAEDRRLADEILAGS
jgi:signal peptide peptidase SppA